MSPLRNPRFSLNHSLGCKSSIRLRWTLRIAIQRDRNSCNWTLLEHQDLTHLTDKLINTHPLFILFPGDPSLRCQRGDFVLLHPPHGCCSAHSPPHTIFRQPSHVVFHSFSGLPTKIHLEVTQVRRFECHSYAINVGKTMP